MHVEHHMTVIASVRKLTKISWCLMSFYIHVTHMAAPFCFALDLAKHTWCMSSNRKMILKSDYTLMPRLKTNVSLEEQGKNCGDLRKTKHMVAIGQISIQSPILFRYNVTSFRSWILQLLSDCFVNSLSMSFHSGLIPFKFEVQRLLGSATSLATLWYRW